MKRHAHQLAHESAQREAISRLRVATVRTPIVQCAVNPGDLAVTVACAFSGGEQHNYAMRLDRWEVEEMAMSAMSSYREFSPFCNRDEEEVRERRKAAMAYLSERLSAALLDFVEKQDPQFGYTRKEWDEMNK
jgi:hypothetical protein